MRAVATCNNAPHPTATYLQSAVGFVKLPDVAKAGALLGVGTSDFAFFFFNLHPSPHSLIKIWGILGQLCFDDIEGSLYGYASHALVF